MKRVAQFYKVSFEQFLLDCQKLFPKLNQEEIQKIYETIQLPKRATKGSAGYDFFTPIRFTLNPKENIQIPTGIRVQIENGWMLQCFPKSGQGTRFRLQLDNTVGIIDSDYFYAQNEGHILVKITNDTNENKVFSIDQNKAFCQGIFVEYGITMDDYVNEDRIGGFGSTNQ